MVGKTLDYSSVPTTAELENNSNQKKYTVNKSPKGDLLISRPACALFVMGALLLAAVAAVITFFLLPRCGTSASPEALRKNTEAAGENKKAAEYVRLPKSIEPTRYRINILPLLGGNFSTSGNVTITLNINENSNKIVFNVKDVDVNPNSVRVKRLRDDKAIKVTSQDPNLEAETYSLELNENLVRGEEYQLEMTFTGYLNDYMVGFYRSHYVDFNNRTRWLASTQFSPTDARRAFPCFDEPSFKSTFTISIARPMNMSTLSNMPKNNSTVILSENLAWDNYQETPPMSSYLVAFAVLDFVPYRYNSSSKLFTIWSTQDSYQFTSYGLNLGPRILQYFENLFDTKYPLPKIDIVAIPDFGFQAMENWGLITFRESSLLFDARTSTIDNKRTIATVLGHELAHQWFGNLVTPSWWDDLWLKEGFATYFEYFGVNYVEPSWKILDEFYFYETSAAFKLDQLLSSRPIHFDVRNSDDIRAAFNSISYSKGASLIRMMSSFLGESTFKEGLKKLLTKKEYSNANHDDLWNVLTEQAQAEGVLKANETVEEIMNGWIHQAGFPVITITAENNTLRFHQKRFLTYGNDDVSAKWYVPIWYTSETNASFEEKKPDMWLRNERETTVQYNASNWYLLNFKQAGYYMVNYDERNWNLLTGNIMNIPPVTRAHLVSDSMDLAQAGLLDYNIPLKLIKSMSKKDTDIAYLPIVTVFAKLSYLYDMLKPTPAFGQLETFVWSAYEFAFDNIRFDESPADTYIRQKIRKTVLEWSCRKRDSRCTINSREDYRRWMSSAFSIPPNIREVVYCTAIREEAELAWNFAYEAYLKANSASEKVTLLRALGCSSKQWILSRYLDLLLQNNSVIRKQDANIVFASVANNYQGRNLAFDFLRSNWKTINEYFGDAFGIVSKMVEAVTRYMHTDFELKQLEDFRKENLYGSSNQAFDHAIEVVKTNNDWMKLNYRSVENWLNTEYPPKLIV